MNKKLLTKIFSLIIFVLIIGFLFVREDYRKFKNNIFTMEFFAGNLIAAAQYTEIDKTDYLDEFRIPRMYDNLMTFAFANNNIMGYYYNMDCVSLYTNIDAFVLLNKKIHENSIDAEDIEFITHFAKLNETLGRTYKEMLYNLNLFKRTDEKSLEQCVDIFKQITKACSDYRIKHQDIIREIYSN